MGKPKQSGRGFSEAKPALATKQTPAQSTATHAARERRALALINQGKLEEAEAIYRELIAARTRNPITYLNLSIIFGRQGRFSEMIEPLGIGAKLDPNNADIHTNLGTAHKEQGDLESAISAYTEAINIKPDHELACYNLGVLLHEKGDPASAIEAYKNAISVNNCNATTQYNCSQVMLLAGDYANGLEKYEYRSLKAAPLLPHAKPKCRLAEDLPPQADSTIHLVSEQGLGDTILFMRYAITLRERGYAIFICAQAELHNLIKASDIDASPLTPQQANYVSEGQWMPLLSIPRHLRVRPGNAIITEPYIKTTNDLKDKWRNILSPEKRPVIGINWQGNPATEVRNLHGRSLPLEAFAPITAKSKIALLSLQKGFGSEQLETCSFKDRFVSCQDQVNEAWDFLETAAIIANCDLVITSDTSVAHLAGGMGKTTWLLLHKVPDWRWGLEGDTTFWYPSMRLFRQRERGNWDEVLERVAEALQQHFPGVSSADSGSSQPKQAEAASTSPKPLAEIQAPISLGELIDKITILEIKTQHLQGNALENVQKELAALQGTLDALDLQVDPTLIQRLKEVNAALWQIEDAIRDQERQKSFGETFIRLARSVYQQNDRRAAIKKEINTTYGSALVEEKAYKGY